MLEYAGQRDDPGHEWRCTALLAALAWTHRQFSLMSGADIESVRRDLTQHLAQSGHEGVDAEALADVLASLCSENAPGGQSTKPSPVHAQLARDVLATLEAQVDASKLLGELIGSIPERHEGQGSGVVELYQSALCAWVAVAPADNARAIAKDRILNMEDGKLDLSDLGLRSHPELPMDLTTFDVGANRLTELPTLPVSLTTLDTDHPLTHLPPSLPSSLQRLREITSAPGYSGPQIHFSIASHDAVNAAARPLHEAVRDGFANDEQAQVHQ
ncbi:hypothetical protein [Pandoraea horticolens]|nr:hypothetical protein [Pandoraea horticolens]